MKRILLAVALLVANSAEANNVPSAVVRFEIPAMYDGSSGMKIGSGVHIGNGFILTAEHVAAKDKALPFLLSNDRQVRTATVLWTNYDYDIALLHAPMEFVPSIDLDCRAPVVGEPIAAVGNLHGLRWFHTRGHVATEPDRIEPRWQEVFAMSGPIGGGMSGGPVTDALGRLIGIVVAGPESESYGFAVPGSVICKLLGRKQ